MSLTTEEIREELASWRYFPGYALADIKRTSKRKINPDGAKYIARTFKAQNQTGIKILTVITDQQDEHILTVMTEQELSDFTTGVCDVTVPDDFIPGYKKFDNKITGEDLFNFVMINCLANPALISECEEALFYYKNKRNWQIGSIDYRAPNISDFVDNLEVDLEKVYLTQTDEQGWQHYIADVLDGIDELVNQSYIEYAKNTIAKFELGLYSKCDTGVRFGVYLTTSNELLLVENNHD